MRIKKVKADSKENRILIIYEQKNASGKTDELSLNCPERAEPSFYKALESLSSDVAKICEIETPDRAIMVSGVTFSYGGEKEVMGATITAKRMLIKSNCALNLNTPHKIEGFYSDKGDEKQLLPSETVKKLGTVMSECERYVNGAREQQKMDI